VSVNKFKLSVSGKTEVTDFVAPVPMNASSKNEEDKRFGI
jgi:hypothetical protein